MGAELNFQLEPRLLIAAIAFGIVLVPLKALVFRFAFQTGGEPQGMSRELATRLSQSSEFSLLVAFAAISIGVLSQEKGMVIQITTIVSLVISTYWIVMRYPTPISGNRKLLQD